MAYLALWNITRSRVDNEKPDYIFETNSCLNTVAFSKTETALIAAGTISGELIIWSLSNELESRVASCSCVEGGHQDAVNKVFWISQSSFTEYSSLISAEYHLVSIGSDGQIICWSLQKNYTSEFNLRPVKSFQVRGKDQSRGVLYENGAFDVTASHLFSNGGVENAARPVGLTTAVFSPHCSEGASSCTFQLLIGTESGGVLMAQLEVPDWTPNPVSEGEYTHTLPSPIKYVLARYSAPIHSVAWSPINRNLVAVSGAFPGVHMYNVLEVSRIYTFAIEEGQLFSLHFPLSNERFSEQNRCLIVCGSEGGDVVIYDLPSGTNTEDEARQPMKYCVLKCKAAENKSNPVFCMAVNDENDSLMAVGCKDGTASIFDTSRLKFFSPYPV
ncbi:hypothetical protein Aperf_G00000040661 [Anoplocephala perfoliata]